MSLFIAFLAGTLSLLSPCTLPVIPLLFAGFRGKPLQLFAMLLGMVAMFVAVSLLVTVASDWVVQATLIGRWIALTLLGCAALGLLFPRVAERVLRPAIQLGDLLNERSIRTHGILSAVLAGMAVGLLWSPCAGPVLGAILGLNLAGGQPVSTAVLLTAYGTGCAAMLALLGIAGQKAVNELRGKQAVMSRLRQLAGVAMLGSVVLTATGMASVLQGANGVADKLEQRLLTLTPAPEPRLIPTAETQPTSTMPSLAGGTGWINGNPATPESLKGKVVLIDFWTFDCINCQHTLPHVREWANKYRQQGLVVIGVHTPEYPWEKNRQSVKNAVNQWQLSYPVVTDNDYQIWNAFGNQYWPAHYYFDVKGQLRYTAFGEGDYAHQEQVIQQLLKEAKA
ncbi:redoxin domain-containing protein [Enterobacteriaceae bacterium RIT691]|nr:redoxin domain-containing protein [Enterobacteriaceae bacterium RIT691]